MLFGHTGFGVGELPSKDTFLYLTIPNDLCAIYDWFDQSVYDWVLPSGQTGVAPSVHVAVLESLHCPWWGLYATYLLVVRQNITIMMQYWFSNHNISLSPASISALRSLVIGAPRPSSSWTSRKPFFQSWLKAPFIFGASSKLNQHIRHTW